GRKNWRDDGSTGCATLKAASLHPAATFRRPFGTHRGPSTCRVARARVRVGQRGADATPAAGEDAGRYFVRPFGTSQRAQHLSGSSSQGPRRPRGADAAPAAGEDAGRYFVRPFGTQRERRVDGTPAGRRAFLMELDPLYADSSF